MGLRFLAGPTSAKASGPRWWTRTAPRSWQPATLAEVSRDDVEAYFAPLGDRELQLSSKEKDNV